MSASKTALPTAAPGEALRPLAIAFAALRDLLLEAGAEQLVDLGGLDALDGLGLGDEAFIDHLDGDLHGRVGGPLGDARLEHVELAALDRELEVLDVLVVLLELAADLEELVVRGRHLGLELADVLRRSDAGDDVLALGIHEVLAVQLVGAVERVAGEGDAGAGVVAHVAEDHRHDVDGGAEVVGDLLAVAVVVGALAEPGAEDGLDREVELLVRIGRELLAGDRRDDLLVLGDEGLEVVDGEVGVLGVLAVLFLGGVERLVEVLGGGAHDDPAEHADEAAIGVPAEALVAREGDEAVEGLVVEAEVEDGVHHARHRELGAGADRDEKRVLRIAEALAGDRFDVLDRREDVVPEAGRELLVRGEVVVAGFGGDGEAGRRGQTGVGHFGKPGTLPAEQVLHGAVAFGLAAAPSVDVALGGLVGLGARFGHEGRHLLGWGLVAPQAAVRARATGSSLMSGRLY